MNQEDSKYHRNSECKTYRLTAPCRETLPMKETQNTYKDPDRLRQEG